MIIVRLIIMNIMNYNEHKQEIYCIKPRPCLTDSEHIACELIEDPKVVFCEVIEDQKVEYCELIMIKRLNVVKLLNIMKLFFVK